MRDISTRVSSYILHATNGSTMPSTTIESLNRVTQTQHATAHAMRGDDMRAGAGRKEDIQRCAGVKHSPPARQETHISARHPITQNQTPLKSPNELPQENNAIHTRHILTSDTKDSTDKHTHTPSATRLKGQTVQIAADRRQYAEQHLRRRKGPQGEDKHKRNKNARETPPKS